MSPILSLLLAAPLSACSAPPPTPAALPEPPVQMGAKVEKKPAAATSIFGEPLFVNGKRITDEEIKLYLIHAPGRNQVAYHKIQLIIDDELRQRAWYWALDQVGEGVGDDPRKMEQAQTLYAKRYQELVGELGVPEEEFQAEYDRRVEDFKHRYPILDVEAEIARAYQSVDWFKKQLRQSMFFDRVFLPVDPETWPPVTVEAFMADPGGGDLLLQDAKDSYKQRLEWAQEHGLDKIPSDDDLLKQIHRQIVRDAIFKVIDFRTPIDGLPQGIALWADTNGDGQPELEMTTEQLWADVQPILIERDVMQAKQWLALTTATHDRMAKEGILLSPEECEEQYTAWEATLEDSTFSVEIAATQNQQFPSVDTWKTYFCMLHGYEKSLADQLAKSEDGDPSPLLKAHFEHAQKVLGLAQVDIDVLLVSAYDFPTNTWKPNGWEWAKKTAEKLMGEIEQNRVDYAEQRKRQLAAEAKGEEAVPSVEVPDANLFWSQMLDDHSEWWDPPPPEHTGKQSSITYKNKGRFGPRYRNDLLGFMGETPYDDYVWGGTVTDTAFFSQEPNTVAGPFRGPLGYYITRINRRSPPSRPLTLADPWQYERIKENYLEVAFRDYSHQALREAEVSGLPSWN